MATFETYHPIAPLLNSILDLIPDPFKICDRTGKRLTILSNSEIESLYKIPSFSTEERIFYFSLDESEKIEMKLLKSLETRLYFILQLGYFKYKYMFFNFTSLEEVKEDVEYILNQYFQNSNLKKIISKQKRSDNNSKILNYYRLKPVGW